MTVKELRELLAEQPDYLVIYIAPPDNTSELKLTGIATVIDRRKFGWLTLATEDAP